jgi:hypothetical protein
MKNLPNVFVEFLALSYPVVDDPVFGDDPRYSAHIIKRP